MQIFRIIKNLTVMTVLLTLTSVASAIPIVFEFTGTVTDQILSNGRIIPAPILSEPDWKNKTVSGKMFIDVEGLATNPNQSAEQIYYSSGYGDNPVDWLSFIITNPDGITYSIPGGFDPLPNYQVNSSVAYLIDSVLNGAHFYVGRSFSDLRPQHTQSFTLRLQAQGPNDSLAISSMDFDTLELQPEFANYQNYGTFQYGHPDGTRFDYYFTINSLVREVPEPASWLLMLGGLGALLIAQRRKFLQ